MKLWKVGPGVAGALIVGLGGLFVWQQYGDEIRNWPGGNMDRAGYGDHSGDGQGGGREAQEAPPPPADDLIALLDGLKAGDKLGACEVASVEGVRDGRARIVAQQDDVTVTLEILRLAEKGPSPPATTQLYGIFYRMSRGDAVDQLPISVIEEAAKALGKRIEKTEKTVPAPAGMGASDEIEERRGVAL